MWEIVSFWEVVSRRQQPCGRRAGLFEDSLEPVYRYHTHAERARTPNNVKSFIMNEMKCHSSALQHSTSCYNVFYPMFSHYTTQQLHKRKSSRSKLCCQSRSQPETHQTDNFSTLITLAAWEKSEVIFFFCAKLNLIKIDVIKIKKRQQTSPRKTIERRERRQEVLAKNCVCRR